MTFDYTVSQTLSIPVNDVSCFLNCMISGIIITLHLTLFSYVSNGICFREKYRIYIMVHLNSMYNYINEAYLVL